jgi:hypothetical protein
MPCLPLSLSLPAMSTSPLRSRRSSSSIIVESPSRRPLPSSCCRAVHCRCAMPSITVKLPLCCPLPHIAFVLSVHHHPPHAIPRHRGVVSPSLAVEELSHRPLPSRSRHTVPLCRGAVTPFIAIEEPSRHPLPSRIRWPCQRAALLLAGVVTIIRHLSCPSQACRLAGCHVSSLLTRPTPICWRLLLWHHILCLLSGWLLRILASHATNSHLPAPLPLIALSPLITPFSGLSSS